MVPKSRFYENPKFPNFLGFREISIFGKTPFLSIRPISIFEHFSSPCINVIFRLFLNPDFCHFLPFLWFWINLHFLSKVPMYSRCILILKNQLFWIYRKNQYFYVYLKISIFYGVCKNDLVFGSLKIGFFGNLVRDPIFGGRVGPHFWDPFLSDPFWTIVDRPCFWTPNISIYSLFGSIHIWEHFYPIFGCIPVYPPILI